MMFAPIMLSSCSGIADCLSSPLYLWFPIAGLAALAVISILSLIYALSPLVGRGDLRVWAKIKAYEVLMSFLLIFIFLAIVAFLGSINFVSMFKAAGLVPGEPGLVGFGMPDCTALSSPDFYTLSMCDLSTFNTHIADLNYLFFVMSFGVSMAPQINIEFQLPVGTGYIGASGNFDIMPTSANKITGLATNGLSAAYILNQIQLYLLASSLMIFALFMAIGLISRIFVITRSFGGAMIAFAIGIGLIFPMLVCLTYGFVDVVIQPYYKVIIGAGYIGSIMSFMAPILLPIAAAMVYAVPPGLAAFLVYGGFVSAGVILIPIMNFTLLDVFIRDFSQAIGERVDFMTLLTRLI